MTSTILPLPPTSESLPGVSEPLPVASRWGLPIPGPAENGQPASLAEVIDHEARSYHAWGTPAGDFLARQLERLGQLVRWTGATTPEEHEARMEVWEEELREEWYENGFEEGRQAGHREAAQARRLDR